MAVSLLSLFCFCSTSKLSQHIPSEFTPPVNTDLTEKCVCVFVCRQRKFSRNLGHKNSSNKFKKTPQFLSLAPCLVQQARPPKTKHLSAGSSLLCLYTSGSSLCISAHVLFARACMFLVYTCNMASVCFCTQYGLTLLWLNSFLSRTDTESPNNIRVGAGELRESAESQLSVSLSLLKKMITVTCTTKSPDSGPRGIV